MGANALDGCAATEGARTNSALGTTSSAERKVRRLDGWDAMQASRDLVTRAAARGGWQTLDAFGRPVDPGRLQRSCAWANARRRQPGAAGSPVRRPSTRLNLPGRSSIARHCASQAVAKTIVGADCRKRPVRAAVVERKIWKFG